MAELDKPAVRIIVDCQVLQTSDRKRGMGLYLSSLLENLQGRNPADMDWIFLVNSRLLALHKDDQALLSRFSGRTLQLALQHQGDSETFNQAAVANRRAVDTAMMPLLTEDAATRTIFFIPALFSREIYPVFPSYGTGNVMLFHDLIPFLYAQQYFRDHDGLPRKDYAQRFCEVYKTDLFVTNSETTADDLTVYFGFDPTRVVPIRGAAAARSSMKPKRPGIAEKLQDGFVFMPSGDDFRKNNLIAAQALAQLHRKEKIIVTSSFSQGSQQALRELCPNIIFTGSVTDEEFLWFLNEARAVLFPTLYEGLGMPVLEAVEQGAKVVCSNIPVFAELSQDAFYYFDPTSAISITQALQAALDTSEEGSIIWQDKRRHYPRILSRFSWDKTADIFIEAVGTCNPKKQPQPRVAVFCPSPSSYSSVGKYAFEVHAELSSRYTIDYYVGEGQTEFQSTRPNILEYAANYYPAATFDVAKASQYDHVLYNIGNSEFHIEGILNALRFPGHVILHDTHLNGIFDYMQHWGFMTDERCAYEALLDTSFACYHSSRLASIATNQYGIFCHSSHAKSALQEVVRSAPPEIYQIVHPIGVPRIELARHAGVTVSFAGIISEDKGISLVSEVSKLPDINVRVFGFGVLGDSPLLQGLGPNVDIVHDLSDKEFQDVLRLSNIVVNYRPNYHGETSRSTLEAMRYGAVVIVKDIGWYSELPNETVVKVHNEIEVITAIRMLAVDPAMRQAIGDAARRFLGEQYSYGRYAKLLTSMIGGKDRHENMV